MGARGAEYSVFLSLDSNYSFLTLIPAGLLSLADNRERLFHDCLSFPPHNVSKTKGGMPPSHGHRAIPSVFGVRTDTYDVPAHN